MHMRSSYRQAGLALPVMLIILAVMLVSSIYLLKSSHSTTLTASNLAYDSAQGRAVDVGLHTGFHWLSETAKISKPKLNSNSATDGYVAILEAGQGTRSSAFWNGSRLLDVGGQRVEYVIHRLCSRALPTGDATNACMYTSENPSTRSTVKKVGQCLGSDCVDLAETPKVHYVITARISGPRGGNVVNQLVVQIGA